MGREKFVAMAVARLPFGRFVRSAVEFDDQTPFETSEVRNERSDRNLSAEFFSTEAASPKMPPKQFFGGCHDAAKRAGLSEPFYWRIITHNPPSSDPASPGHLLPQAGEGSTPKSIIMGFEEDTCHRTGMAICSQSRVLGQRAKSASSGWRRT